LKLERKQVTVHYRRFDREDTTKSSLENLIRSAMSTAVDSAAQLKDRYRHRLRTINDDNYFVNYYEDGSSSAESLVFGDVLHFTKGHLQALCDTTDADAAALPVKQMKAPERAEYVHSQMFWMVKGNHAFVVQSMSLRTADLEDYLSWLLSIKTHQIPTTHPVVLNMKFDDAAIGGDLNDIQEIIVGGAVAARETVPEEPATELRETEITTRGQIDTGRAAGWATARKILVELLGGDANVDNLMEAVPPEAELNVQVHIGYKTRKRRIDRLALRQLETGLRNLPDSQLQVKAKSADVATDGTIRLHHDASILLLKATYGKDQIIGSLMDPKDVLRAMIEAYKTFVANGKIQE
jgi:hypothetical protein